MPAPKSLLDLQGSRLPRAALHSVEPIAIAVQLTNERTSARILRSTVSPIAMAKTLFFEVGGIPVTRSGVRSVWQVGRYRSPGGSPFPLPLGFEVFDSHSRVVRDRVDPAVLRTRARSAPNSTALALPESLHGTRQQSDSSTFHIKEVAADRGLTWCGEGNRST